MSFGKKENRNIGIRICGVGGMGVILTSVILGKAAIYNNKNALQTQSYGAEQRGTKVRSDVIISEEETINYPVIDKADVLIAFSQEALEFYLPITKKDGLIFINSDNIQYEEKRNNVHKIPATTLAMELNDKRVANIIMLGALIKATAVVSKESLIKSITDTVKEKYKELNIQAFLKGYEYI